VPKKEILNVTQRQLRYLFNLFLRIVRAQTPKLARLLEVLALAQIADKSDGSYAGEYEHLDKLLSDLGTTKGYIVDIAAGNGYRPRSISKCNISLWDDVAWASSMGS
jgi:hypothetical protein